MEKTAVVLGTIISYLIILSLPAYFVMLGLGGLGVSAGFLPVYSLTIAARLFKALLLDV